MNAPDQTHLALGARTQELAERAARVMPGRQSNLRAQAEPSVFIERALGQLHLGLGLQHARGHHKHLFEL